MKKLTSIILSILMMCSICTSAFAQEVDYREQESQTTNVERPHVAADVVESIIGQQKYSINNESSDVLSTAEISTEEIEVTVISKFLSVNFQNRQ